MVIESDASNQDWGARHREVRTGGVWATTEASNHINYLDLLAAYLAVQCFAKQKCKIIILLQLENVTTGECNGSDDINKMGGTHYMLNALI